MPSMQWGGSVPTAYPRIWVCSKIRWAARVSHESSKHHEHNLSSKYRQRNEGVAYRVTKRHKMPYLYTSLSAKEPYNYRLFCCKRHATQGFLCIFATLYPVCTLESGVESTLDYGTACCTCSDIFQSQEQNSKSKLSSLFSLKHSKGDLRAFVSSFGNELWKMSPEAGQAVLVFKSEASAPSKVDTRSGKEEDSISCWPVGVTCNAEGISRVCQSDLQAPHSLGYQLSVFK